MPERPNISDYENWRDDLTPQTLWARVCDGDDEAWARLATVWTPCIAMKCRKSGISQDDVADVTQLVMMRIYRYRDRFSREKQGQRLKHWLLMIIKQCIATHGRKFASGSKAAGGDSHHQQIANVPGFDFDPNAIEPDNGPTSEELFDRKTWLAQLLKVIEQETSPLTWQIFTMFKFDGLTTREISEKTGVSEGAIRVRVHGIVKRIRIEGEGLFEEDETGS